MSSLARRSAVEAAATFGLVFLGTGACVVDAATRGRLGVVCVGLAWGGAVFALARLTGAHMNPAVSAVAALTPREKAAYLAAQCAGALGASVLLRLAAGPLSGSLGATFPAAGVGTAWCLEAVMTFALVWTVRRAPARHVAAAAGAVVAVEAVLAGPLTGASMNPARSLAPALVSGSLGGLWIYLTAPFVGAAAASVVAAGEAP